MVNFLFWNLKGKDLHKQVAYFARKYDVDVLILAECNVPEADMLRGLNGGVGNRFHGPHEQHSECKRIVIYPRFLPRFLKTEMESNHWTMRRLSLPARTDILLVAAHLSSKREKSEASQNLALPFFGYPIREQEKKAGNRRTIVVGDLNMNPFEHAVVGATGLHAVMTREVALRGSRTVNAIDHPFFYNPMWGHFGDRNDGPPGTCFYWRSEEVAYFWNAYDQVLIRPELLERFPTDSLQILEGDKRFPLLDERGRPDRNAGSDHLPIFFRLNL